MTLPDAVHRVEIDPQLLASDQLRQLSDTYLELADWLDGMTTDPKKQADYLAQMIQQTQESARP